MEMDIAHIDCCLFLMIKQDSTAIHLELSVCCGCVSDTKTFVLVDLDSSRRRLSGYGMAKEVVWLNGERLLDLELVIRVCHLKVKLLKDHHERE